MRLYVGNLPYSFEDATLKDLFSQFGEVTDAIVIKNKYNGRSKGFGFVEMPNEEEAKEAIAQMNEKEVQGRPLKVNEARPAENNKEFS